MIQPINSVSFKSLWVRKDIEYTEKQKQCVEDIKNHLKERIFEDDFYMQPGKDADSVELSYLKGLDEKNNKFDKRVIIGEFSRKYPFNIDDLDEVKKTSSKNPTAFIAIASAALIALLSLAVSKCSTSAKAKQVVEKVAPTNNDSIQEIVKKLPIWVK